MGITYCTALAVFIFHSSAYTGPVPIPSTGTLKYVQRTKKNWSAGYERRGVIWMSRKELAGLACINNPSPNHLILKTPDSPHIFRLALHPGSAVTIPKIYVIGIKGIIFTGTPIKSPAKTTYGISMNIQLVQFIFTG